MKTLSHFIDFSDYKENFESDLNQDETAKTFWAGQLPILIAKFSAQASAECTSEDCQLRVLSYRSEYTKKVEEMINNKAEFLSVRMLLELNEMILKKFGFKDIYKSQKQIENSQAIKVLNKRLRQIDQIKDESERWLELFRGVLAGNIFDSGATAVQEILSANQSFGLDDALGKIPERPWLIDSFEQFMQRLENEPIHKCAAFFCDNSGVDIVLGVIPFVRELLRRETKVILCANSEPSLNDVTCRELSEIVEEVGESCPIIKSCLKTKSLVVKESGQKGCCLNFLDIDEDLVETMLQYKVDLLIIEGMGRSLHTNLNSTFKCESLKLAVIKNKFLASRLGGNLFDAICKYEKGYST